MGELRFGPIYIFAKPKGVVRARILGTGRVPSRRPMGNVHLTLADLCDGDRCTADLVLRYRQALATLEATVFRVILERVVVASHTLLVGRRTMHGVRSFQALFRRHLALQGLVVADLPGPHVTLDYQPDGRGEEWIDPIIWEVEEILLVESLGPPVGHKVHGRWRLRKRVLLAA